MYKIKNYLVPSYLSNLCPPEVGELVQYELRRKENIIVPPTKKYYLLKSFFPSTIRLWNEIDNEIRNVATLRLFKIKIRKYFSVNEFKKIYLLGLGYPSTNLSRMRMGPSALNYQRKQYRFITDSNHAIMLEKILWSYFCCPKRQTPTQSQCYFTQ